MLFSMKRKVALFKEKSEEMMNFKLNENLKLSSQLFVDLGVSVLFFFSCSKCIVYK